MNFLHERIYSTTGDGIEMDIIVIAVPRLDLHVLLSL